MKKPTKKLTNKKARNLPSSLTIKSQSKKTLNLPKTIPAKEKALKQKFTTGYYQCLADNWGAGKITDCCMKCKKEAQHLTIQRESEIDKLGKAYRQLGESLFTLLKPIKPPKH